MLVFDNMTVQALRGQVCMESPSQLTHDLALLPER